MRSLLFGTLIASLCVATSFSATIHVPADEPTIQAGVNIALDGDIVFVSPGSYNEAVMVSKKGVRIIAASGPLVTFLTHTDGVKFDSSLGGELNGFTIVAGGLTSSIYVSGGSDCTITNCRFLDYSAEDVIRSGGVIKVSRCVFACFTSGNTIVTVAPDCQFIGNTVHGGFRGIAMFGPNNIIKNNIIVNQVRYGIGPYHATTVADFNNVWNNSPNYDPEVSPGPSDISLDPLFTDTSVNDFCLQAMSPCIGSGELGADMGANPAECDGDPQGPVVTMIDIDGPDIDHILDHTPTITWGYFDLGGLPHSASELEVGTDIDWTTAEMWQSGTIPAAATLAVYAGSPLQDGAEYRLRARVNNGVVWSDWEERAFRMNSVPSSPMLSSPPDGGLVFSHSPLLIISSAQDPENDPLVYKFEVYADAGLTTLSASVITPATSWAVSPPLSDPDSMYWWRVAASDGYEYGPWSSVRMYEVSPAGPPGPDAVTIESKTFSAGQQDCKVGIFITNSNPIIALFLPFEIRENTPGAYVTGSFTRSIIPTNRLGSSPLGFANNPGTPGGWPAASITMNRYSTPGGNSCSGPLSSTYKTPVAQIDFISPDGFSFASVSTGDAQMGESISMSAGSDLPGISNASIVVTFDVTTVAGSFVIDTMCVPSHNHLGFYGENSAFIAPAFTAGIITIDCCMCHGDPAQCNGIQNVVDLVYTINVAFRGEGEIADPALSCPRMTTDVNCDGNTSVVDVVRMSNVTFRGADPTNEFCNPCP